MPDVLSADEAARRLGVRRATLYSYVSRGLVRSEPGTQPRERCYRQEDVDRLLSRRDTRRHPERAAQEALHWGAPVLESALTLIRDGRVSYRGRDAIELARGRRLEEVAALLWADRLDPRGLFDGAPPLPAGLANPGRDLAGLGQVEAFQVALPLAAAGDPAAFDLNPDRVARTGARLLRLLTAVAAGHEPSAAPVAEVLARAWTGGAAAASLLDEALILVADHELNVSAFAVRCAASAGANVYAAVTAGLAALGGHKHGGTVERAAALLREAATVGPEAAVTGLLRRGQGVAGFGHPLYPGGDPRGRALLQSLDRARPSHPGVDLARRVAEETRAALGESPTIDFGLATLARVLDLPPGGGLALFALGRSVGWIAHAIEEYEADRLIRPRARYTGLVPA